MANSYSVKAILSAQDKGFTSTMKNAQSMVQNLGSTIKGGLGMGVLMGVGQQAFSSLTNNVKGLFKETTETSDAMQKLEQAMKFSGGDPKEIKKTIKGLKDYADKTVFELKDVTSTFGALSANGIKDCDKLTMALGNAVAVYGGGAREFSSVGLAFSQAMAAGALHAQDWNQILNASPQLAGGLRKELIKLNPVIGEDFKGAMEDGVITSELLAQAVKNIGMSDFAAEAARSTSTVEGAVGNMKATVVNGLLEMYDSFMKSKVVDGINWLNTKLGKGFEWIMQAVPKVVNTIKPYWEAFAEAFKGVGQEFGYAFSAIKHHLKMLLKDFGSAESVEKFKNVMSTVADALKKFADFCTDNSDKIATLITNLPKLWLAFKGYKIVSSVAPSVMQFGKAIGLLAGKGIGNIAGRLTGISKGQAEVGATSDASSGSVMTAAKSFALMGVAVFLLALGFGVLALSSIALANAGGLAIGVMVGMVAAIVGLGFGMAMLLKFLAPMSAQLMPAAIAMLALGGAVLVVSVAFGVLAIASIALANAGGLAIGVMAGLVLALAGLMTLAAFLAPMMTAGAVGFIAFGAALLLCSVAAVLAATSLVILSTALPTIAQYGLQGALAITALGLALTVFTVGATLAGVAFVALGAGLVVLGAGLLVVTASVIAFGAGMLISCAGVLAMGAALTLVKSQLKSISSNAKATQKSLNSMKSSVKLVESGLDALGSKANSAMKKLISAFNDAESKAKTSGKAVGDGFSTGMQVGLTKAPAIAITCISAVYSALASGQSSAYAAGAYISIGFAQGMLSQLWTIQNAAAQMAAAADQAVRAKAKIHSPSRVAGKLGSYWVQGFANKLVDGAKDVWKAAQNLVNIPRESTNGMQLAFAGNISDEYSYYRNAEYNIVVTSEIDGKEVARTTAKYTEDELSKRERRSRRKRGKV